MHKIVVSALNLSHSMMGGTGDIHGTKGKIWRLHAELVFKLKTNHPQGIE